MDQALVPDSLAALGWNAFFQAEQDTLHALTPMRVTVEHQDRYTVIGDSGQRTACISGLLLRDANQGGRRPAVGDWVALAESGLIVHLFQRISAFQRTNSRGKLQVIAANIDTVLVVTSCNAEFNAQRVERYVAAVEQSGATAVVVLSKIDLVRDLKAYTNALHAILSDIRIVQISVPTGYGLPQLSSLLGYGQTIAIVGSSGVGKSTLANALLGSNVFTTAAIREHDAKGRHTTTRRELAVLPKNRGVLIDTPGMREFQLNTHSSPTKNKFPDIHELAQLCRFRDCQHHLEPHCAVRGSVSDARLVSFQQKSAFSQTKSKSYTGTITGTPTGKPHYTAKRRKRKHQEE